MHAPLNAPFRSQNQLTAVRAELFGSNRCTALGVEAHSAAPVLDLCRKLKAAGHDSATPLEAFRRGTLCLRVRSIGEGARLRIATHGVGFEPLHECTGASPIAPIGAEAPEEVPPPDKTQRGGR
jgi:hypothetical protein